MSDTRYSSRNPCPVCQEQRDTKCSSKPADGEHLTLYRCRGTPARPDEWCFIDTTTNGFKLYHSASDRERSSWRWSFDHDPDEAKKKRKGKKPNRPVGGVRPAEPDDDAGATSASADLPVAGPEPLAAHPSAPALPAPPPIDWQAKAERYSQNLAQNPKAKAWFAADIELPPAALDTIADIGLIPAEPGITSERLSLPERDATRKITGLATRHHPGLGPTRDEKAEKLSMSGSARGLILPTDWREMIQSWLLINVEGHTDVMALAVLGIACFGRSSNSGDADKIAEVMKPLKGRTLVIMGENDRHPNTEGKVIWPGKEGAEAVAREVRRLTGQSVFIAYPEEDYKDARAWVVGLNKSGEFLTVEAVRNHIIDHIVGTAREVTPDGSTASDASSPQGRRDKIDEMFPLLDPVPVVRNPGVAPQSQAGEGGPGESPAPTGNCPHGDGCGDGCEVRPFYTGPAGDAEALPPADVKMDGQRGRSSIRDDSLIELLPRLRKTRPKPNHPHFDETTGIIGPPPEFRPCWRITTHWREGIHPSTEGVDDWLATTCGQCPPCQGRRRHREKLLHVSAALACATHRWSGSEDEWRRFERKLASLRKKYGVKAPFGYSRVVTHDCNKRVSFFSIPRDAGIPDEHFPELDLTPVTSRQAAERISRAVDEIPSKLPADTRWILSNAAWRAAGIQPAKKPDDELPKPKLFTSNGPQRLQGPDLDWAAKVAKEEGAWVEELATRHYRVEQRLLIGSDGDEGVSDATFRRQTGLSREQARLQGAKAKEQRIVSRRRRKEAERAEREADRSIRQMHARYAGRPADKVPAFYRTFLMPPTTTGGPPTGNAA